MSHPLNGTVPALKCECGHFAKADEVTECRFCDCVQHRPAQSPYRGHDPETPPGAEAALQQFSDDLEAARLTLKATRDTEVKAKAARDKAKRYWTLHADCPRVARDAFTCAYRDAWVGDKIEAEEDAYDAARLARQAAQEHLKTLREQGIIQMGITKSVNQSFQGQRGPGW